MRWIFSLSLIFASCSWIKRADLRFIAGATEYSYFINYDKKMCIFNALRPNADRKSYDDLNALVEGKGAKVVKGSNCPEKIAENILTAYWLSEFPEKLAVEYCYDSAENCEQKFLSIPNINNKRFYLAESYWPKIHKK
jgi:hypothetical protein